MFNLYKYKADGIGVVYAFKQLLNEDSDFVAKGASPEMWVDKILALQSDYQSSIMDAICKYYERYSYQELFFLKSVNDFSLLKSYIPLEEVPFEQSEEDEVKTKIVELLKTRAIQYANNTFKAAQRLYHDVSVGDRKMSVSDDFIINPTVEKVAKRNLLSIKTLKGSTVVEDVLKSPEFASVQDTLLEDIKHTYKFHSEREKSTYYNHKITTRKLTPAEVAECCLQDFANDKMVVRDPRLPKFWLLFASQQGVTEKYRTITVVDGKTIRINTLRRYKDFTR